MALPSQPSWGKAGALTGLVREGQGPSGLDASPRVLCHAWNTCTRSAGSFLPAPTGPQEVSGYQQVFSVFKLFSAFPSLFYFSL